MVGAIVLAAGASARMGSPKALLTIRGTSFLQHLVEVLSGVGISNIVVVLGAEAEEIRRSLSWYHGECVVNDQWELGQLSSALAGLRRFLHTPLDGIFLCPVDRPLVSERVLAGMLRLFPPDGRHIVVPTFQERRGHPLLIGSALFPALEQCSSRIGVRELLWKHPDEILEYPTEEEGILINIDTPDAYRRNVTP